MCSPFKVTKPGPLWDLNHFTATIDGQATFRAPWAWSLACLGRVQNQKVRYITVYMVTILYDIVWPFCDVTVWFVKGYYVIWGYADDNDDMPGILFKVVRVSKNGCPSPSLTLRPAIDAEGVDLGTTLAWWKDPETCKRKGPPELQIKAMDGDTPVTGVIDSCVSISSPISSDLYCQSFLREGANFPEHESLQSAKQWNIETWSPKREN